MRVLQARANAVGVTGAIRSQNMAISNMNMQKVNSSSVHTMRH
jgi:hypothetical protein